jgi:predicted transcriptional regulator
LSVEAEIPQLRILEKMADDNNDSSLLELATELTMAWLANPNTRAAAEDVPAFLQSMHGAVSTLAAPQSPVEEAAPAAQYTPAVPVRRSISSPDHIISLIDGKPYKTLKRHLSGHGLTPAQYRERYGLKADYPMVAASYAEMRRGLAKQIGLGRKPGAKVTSKAAKPVVDKDAAKPANKAASAPAVPKKAATPAAKPKAARVAKSNAKPKLAKPAPAETTPEA